MSQSRRHALLEAIAGTAIGFVISVTAIFTVLSIARGYAVRRAFNWLHLVRRI